MSAIGKPIIFSSPMVRALLDGRKTMTRRLDVDRWRDLQTDSPLWVRENWRAGKQWERTKPRDIPVGEAIWLQADAPFPIHMPGKLRPSIFLPRWASRLTLIVERVKIERLQDISEEDAIAEGIEACDGLLENEIIRLQVESGGKMMGEDARTWFAALWSTLHGPDAWDANPWVVALTFRVVKANIDAVIAQGEAAASRVAEFDAVFGPPESWGPRP